MTDAQPPAPDPTQTQQTQDLGESRESQGPEQTEGRLVLCPYCGHTQANPVRCEACRGLFEPLSRKATQISMGPWYIRDMANPFRPGCSYETLKRQIEAGRVKATSIIRGPTSRQFWSVAKNVPGVAHLVGFCHRCHASVRSSDPRCPACGEPFGGMTRRNELGLSYPTPEAAEAAQRELDRERQGLAQGAAPANAALPSAAAAPTGDLLDQVLQAGSPSAASGPTSGPGPASGAPAPTAGGASLPGVPEPQGLDFAPSAQATEGAASPDPGPPLPPVSSGPTGSTEPTEAHRSSAVVWLLVLLNAIAAAAAVLLAWYFLF